MRIERIVAAACLLLATGLCQDRQNWTHYVRIGGHGLRSGNADEILRRATASHVFGIEVDNDITGRYESFLDPAAKLEAIREVAKKAHEAGNYAFVYIAGTECIALRPTPLANRTRWRRTTRIGSSETSRESRPRSAVAARSGFAKATRTSG